MFWIPLEKYNTFFTSLTTNIYIPDYKVSSYEGKTFEWGTKPWKELNAWASVENTETQDVVLDCVQDDAHLFP